MDNKQYDVFGLEASKRLPFIVWLLSIIVYRVSMAPVVIWGDSAGLAVRVSDFLLDPASDGHPLYIILGKIFSFLPGDMAANLNLMSVVFASFAVLFVFLIIRNITGHNLPALIGAAAFQFSHAFWLHAVITEVYALNAFFMAGTIYLMLLWKDNIKDDKYLLWASLLFGLSLSHHLVLGLFGFSVLYFLFAYNREIFTNWKRFSKLILYFLAGLALFIVLFLYWYFAYSAKETVAITVGRQHSQYMLRFPIKMVVKNIILYLAYQMYQFPLLGFFLGWKGVKEMFAEDRKMCIFLFSVIFVNATFFIGFVNLYETSNYTFYITDYMIFSLFIGYGAHALVRKWAQCKDEVKYSIRQKCAALLILIFLFPLAGYSMTPFLSGVFGVNLLGARDIAYRNNEWFFLFPPKTGYTGALRFGKEAFEAVEDGSTIIADYTPCAVLEYLQKVKGMRPKVTVIDVNDASEGTEQNNLRPFVDENFKKGGLYIADIENKWYYNLEDFPPDFDVEKAGLIYKVIKTHTSK